MKWRCAGLGLFFIMTWTRAFGADVFYEQRLTAGKAALLAHRDSDAAEQLRIAAFGFLDSPKKLTEALALLAVAQNTLERTTEVETTVNRFVEVESRFAAWDPAMLDVALRNQFESILLRVVPKQTLASVKSLAGLVQPAVRPVPRPDVLQEATRLMSERRPAEAAGLLSDAVNREPNRRDLRLLLLQAASMSSKWQLGVTQVAALKPFADSEAVPMFYGAVALFESGRTAEARELLDRALPKLTRSPYVDQYAKRIKSSL